MPQRCRHSDSDRCHAQRRIDRSSGQGLGPSQHVLPAVSLLSVMSICIRNLHKRYQSRDGEVTALAGVELEVGDGEFVAIVGPSGCGKSTLLYILGGFILADGGSVAVEGKPINGPGVDRGIVFQEYALFPWLTVAQNIRYGLE